MAPECNVQCNYCDRRYDCINESRPGLTSRILDPDDVYSCLKALLTRGTDVSVIGIAGPGDALCEPERTLEAIRAARRACPGLLVCLSTNGLNLSEHVDALAAAGVTHVTVTVNAVEPSVGEKIYAWARVDDATCRGREAAELLISRQREALIRLKSKGLFVKINTVILPGINAGHVRSIAREVAALGAHIMNCLPLIPVARTPFAAMESMLNEDVERIRSIASQYLPQMTHCRRCRSDAVGLL